MLPRMIAVVLTVSLGGVAGCGSKADAPAAAKVLGGVGVVDLDIIAKRLGRDQEMNSAIKERMGELNDKLTTLQGSLKKLYDDKRDSLGEELSDDERKQLLTMQDNMDTQLRSSKNKAELELARYKQELIDQFREQAKPASRVVAASRGLSIVLPKNNALLLTIDPAVDITDDVAEKMAAAKPASTDRADDKPRTKKEAKETSQR